MLLLENLRFHAEETANDPDFARALAEGVDVYVNDAFGTAHRAHASTAGMVEFVPNVAAGLLLQRELDALAAALEPERPFVCFLGGAKVSDKLGVLEALIERADTVGVGGAMAYTFLSARGEPIGRSLVEPDRLDDARRMIARAAERGCELLLPTDHVVADRVAEDADSRIVHTIPENMLGVDIGPETTARYAAAAAGAAHDPLERPDGRLRDRRLRARNGRRRPGDRRLARTQHRRRRRLARGRSQGRSRRPDRPSLDGRRRLARVRSGPHAAGRGRAGTPLMSRTPLVCGNWKMNLTSTQAAEFAADLLGRLEAPFPAPIELAIAPAHPVPSTVSGEPSRARGSRWPPRICMRRSAGAFTGEVSLAMLEDLGCRYALIGHSERRQLFGEHDLHDRGQGASGSRRSAVRPILCVGETLDEREHGATLDVVGGQLRGRSRCDRMGSAKTSVVAYEPVWAIGSGRTATPQTAQEVHAAIRRRCVSGSAPPGTRFESSTADR